jgi:uncharacterized protein (DUF2237 family)
MIPCPNPECRGVFPPADPGEWVCRCGSAWADAREAVAA